MPGASHRACSIGAGGFIMIIRGWAPGGGAPAAPAGCRTIIRGPPPMP